MSTRPVSAGDAVPQLVPRISGSDLPQPPRPKTALLGLPCSECGAYYDAGSDSCPICGCKDRASTKLGSRSVHHF